MPAPDQILVLNAGSSSLKFALYGDRADPPQVVLRGQLSGLPDTPRLQVRDATGRILADLSLQQTGPLSQTQALDRVLDWLDESETLTGLSAVGHRVVHGGMHYNRAVRVDAPVLALLRQLIPLAPLHQPYNLAAIERMAERHPQLPQVACFDTAFHRSNSELVQHYALPEALFQSGVRRYGFHGLSYNYIASVLACHDPRAAEGKTIVLHLGSGASLCALSAGVSVASSMGFSALDGIPMSTRCGALDPGVILYLLQARGMSAAEIQDLLYQQSGLLGVSGISGDMKRLSASAEPAASLAIELYAYWIVREIGSLTAALGGLDALVFTAGIGEHSSEVRARVLAQLGWLGVDVDGAANLKHGPRISLAGSRVQAWVIGTNEESIIAGQTRQVLDSASSS